MDDERQLQMHFSALDRFMTDSEGDSMHKLQSGFERLRDEYFLTRPPIHHRVISLREIAGRLLFVASKQNLEFDLCEAHYQERRRFPPEDPTLEWLACSPYIGYLVMNRNFDRAKEILEELKNDAIESMASAQEAIDQINVELRQIEVRLD